jgi:hypothetical protein
MKKLDQVFKISIILAILLIGFSVFYYYAIFLPQLEQQKLRRTLVEACLKQAGRDYAKCLREVEVYVEKGIIPLPAGTRLLDIQELREMAE